MATAIKNNKKAVALKEEKQSKNKAYVIAKRLIEEKKLNLDILTDSDSKGEDYIFDLVTASLNRLAPVKLMLESGINDDKLTGFELEGTMDTINDVYNLLDAAFRLYMETEH